MVPIWQFKTQNFIINIVFNQHVQNGMIITAGCIMSHYVRKTENIIWGDSLHDINQRY